MNTKKLYYIDCHLREFTATVTHCRQCSGGWEILLDATAFYPEGGGQACDLGTLGGVRVLDVQEREETVLHLCDGPLEVGTTVTGHIDWARRFDLMQQHSGEHIVSGLIYQNFGYHNVGFHVGKDGMEIDFDGPISMEALLQIERQANEAVFANLPIKCWYPSEEALASVFYRTKKQLAWPVRLVQIPGVDSCACCGVHTAYTGEIGLIKILSCVKFHQGVRIGLVCGGRAVALVQDIFEQNRQVSQLFSAKLPETAEAARRMTEALAAEKLRANTLQSALFIQIAQSCQGNTLLFRQELEPGAVRELADKIAGVCGGWAAVLSGREQAYTVCIVGPAQDTKPLCEALKTHLNARGGGKPGYFQGSIPAARADIEAVFAGFM